MRRLVLVASATLLPATARAWRLIEPSPYVWSHDDVPIAFWVDEDCPESVAPTTCVDVVREAMDPWNATPCSWLEFAVAGVSEVDATFDLGDLRHTIAFDDPSGDLEPGVLGATLVQRFGLGPDVDDRATLQAQATDIALNDGVVWTTDFHVAAGTCVEARPNLTAVLTHELGHVAGLGHSCDDGEPCSDPALLGATMHWTQAASCDPSRGVTADDAAGLQALYGPRFEIACNPTHDGVTIGVVPLTVRCTLASVHHLPELTDVAWSFGDGAVAHGASVEHTYVEAGAFGVTAELSGAGEDCEAGAWSQVLRRERPVVACDVPEPAFTVEHVDRLTYAMRNETPTDPFGCLHEVQWQVFEGVGRDGPPIAESASWEPVFPIPEAGPVTVVLHVGGLAGTGAAKLEFDARNTLPDGYGCLAPPQRGASLGALMLPLALLRGRRRERSAATTPR